MYSALNFATPQFLGGKIGIGTTEKLSYPSILLRISLSLPKG